MPTSRWVWSVLGACCLIGPSFPAQAQAAPDLKKIDALLTEGQFEEASTQLEDWLEDHPQDGSRQLALGVARLALAYQDTFREMQTHGARFSPRGRQQDASQRPKDPPKVTYKDARRLLRNARNRFRAAQIAFSKADHPDAKFPVHLTNIPIDIDGNGSFEPNERIGKLIQVASSDKDAFFVVDQTDALWMEAQCHVILGTLSFVLAYDWSETFAYVAHAAFWNPDSAWNDQLGVWNGVSGRNEDAIALLHLIRWPLHSKRRMREALRHGEAFSAKLSKALDVLSKETDDDHELLAAPHQTASNKLLSLSASDLKKAREIADFAGRILAGKVLAPRVEDLIKFAFNKNEPIPRGVNLRRFFTEPRDFDLMLWIQGSAATPYMEEGQVELAAWRRIVYADWPRQLRFLKLP